MVKPEGPKPEATNPQPVKPEGTKPEVVKPEGPKPEATTSQPPPASRIKLNAQVDRPDDPTYQKGESVSIKLDADRDCYLAVYNIDATGKVALLFPNRFTADNHVTGGQSVTIPPPGAVWEWGLLGPAGEEQIWILASEKEPASFPGQDEFKQRFPEVSSSPDNFARAMFVREKPAQAVGDEKPEDTWTSMIMVRLYVEVKDTKRLKPTGPAAAPAQ